MRLIEHLCLFITKDRIQKFRIERVATSEAATSSTTTINEDEANANSVRLSQPGILSDFEGLHTRPCRLLHY
jgi:hypothetical protein